MRGFGRGALLLAGVAGCVAAGDDVDPELGGTTQPIIYGADDRRDVADHPDPALRQIAQSAVVSLIPRSQFARGASGNVVIVTRKLGDALDVCDGERFTEQPTAAVCSGVLLDDDLVLTAGHCFPDDGCERYAFVFDYYYRSSPDQLESIGWGDIYGCRRIVDKAVSPDTASSRIDYALVQLDRPAVGRQPVEVRTTQLLPGEPLATIGAASGLPVKIDSGSRVLDTRPGTFDYFLLDSDTFEGSSGSGVFDATAKLTGVLVRGGKDYTQRGGEKCMVPNVVDLAPDASVFPRGVGEEATYVGRVVEGLCAKGWPSTRLCNRSPTCGDGFCSASESRALCPQDCGCTQRNCETKSAPPAAAGAIAKASSKTHEDDGCALAAGRSPAWLLAVLALLALAARRRAQRPS